MFYGRSGRACTVTEVVLQTSYLMTGYVGSRIWEICQSWI